jgi:hypothetical protein
MTVVADDSFALVAGRSVQLERDIAEHPDRFRVLTGDRPTGPLHLGHYFAELHRNPTVKAEAAGARALSGLLFTYPVHQAADILFCRGNLVPVGKDQLPHVETTRLVARRFNERFAAGAEVFPEPDALLTDAPLLLGVDDDIGGRGAQGPRHRGRQRAPATTAAAATGHRHRDRLSAPDPRGRQCPRQSGRRVDAPAGPRGDGHDLLSPPGAERQPRPTNGIVVAITVRNSTLAESGRPAM